MSILSDSNGTEWVKTNDTSSFNVDMGGFMGAEICDLIGLYIIFYLSSVNSLLSFFLYRDDDLAVLNRFKCENDIATKRTRSIFKTHGFKISVESYLIQTDFLVVTPSHHIKRIIQT